MAFSALEKSSVILRRIYKELFSANASRLCGYVPSFAACAITVSLTQFYEILQKNLKEGAEAFLLDDSTRTHLVSLSRSNSTATFISCAVRREFID